MSYRYSIIQPNDKSVFLIKQTPKMPLYPGQLLMNIRTEFVPPVGSVKESNMTVMEIGLPSGYATHLDNLRHLHNINRVQKIELENDASVIVIYFCSLVAGGMPICFDVSADRIHVVNELKPAAISIYDYYNTEQRTTIFYEVPS